MIKTFEKNRHWVWAVLLLLLCVEPRYCAAAEKSALLVVDMQVRAHMDEYYSAVFKCCRATNTALCAVSSITALCVTSVSVTETKLPLLNSTNASFSFSAAVTCDSVQAGVGKPCMMIAGLLSAWGPCGSPR